MPPPLPRTATSSSTIYPRDRRIRDIAELASDAESEVRLSVVRLVGGRVNWWTDDVDKPADLAHTLAIPDNPGP